MSSGDGGDGGSAGYKELAVLPKGSTLKLPLSFETDLTKLPRLASKSQGSSDRLPQPPE